MRRKSLVSAIEDRDEVSFECLNCSFGKVVAMVVGMRELVFQSFGFNALREFFGDFIVKAL